MGTPQWALKPRAEPRNELAGAVAPASFQLLDLATAPAPVQIAPISASSLLAYLPSARAAALRDRYPLELGRGGMSSRGLP